MCQTLKHRAVESFKHHEDRRRREAPVFWTGDRFWLSTWDLRLNVQSHKLAPFLVPSQVNLVFCKFLSCLLQLCLPYTSDMTDTRSPSEKLSKAFVLQDRSPLEPQVTTFLGLPSLESHSKMSSTGLAAINSPHALTTSKCNCCLSSSGDCCFCGCGQETLSYSSNKIYLLLTLTVPTILAVGSPIKAFS